MDKVVLSVPALARLVSELTGGALPDPDGPEPDPTGPLGPISRAALGQYVALGAVGGLNLQPRPPRWLLARLYAQTFADRMTSLRELAEMLPAESARQAQAQLSDLRRSWQEGDDLCPPLRRWPWPWPRRFTPAELLVIGLTLHESAASNPELGELAGAHIERAASALELSSGG